MQEPLKILLIPIVLLILLTGCTNSSKMAVVRNGYLLLKGNSNEIFVKKYPVTRINGTS